MRNKILPILLVIIMASTMVSAASRFTDTEGHWAEVPIPYISEMADKGYLLGDGDGKFRPEDLITKGQALLIASRIMGFNDPVNKEIVEFAYKKYEEILAPYAFQYKSEISYLLYWGVLTPSTVGSYISQSYVDSPVTRHEAAVLLTHLMGKDAVSQTTKTQVNVHTYADQNDIPSQSRAYVNYVTQEKLMLGMGDNRFEPGVSLTRAMMSTIMYRLEKKMNLTFTEGVVTSSKSGYVKAVSQAPSGQYAINFLPDGASKEESYVVSTECTIASANNAVTSITNIPLNTYARVNAKNGIMYSINLNVSPTIQYVDLKVGEDKITPYQFNDYSTVLLDGDIAKTSDYKEGQIVRLYQQNYEAADGKTTRRTRLLSAISTQTETATSETLTSGFIKSIRINQNNEYVVNFLQDGKLKEDQYTISKDCLIYSELNIPIDINRIPENAYCRIVARDGVLFNINLDDSAKRLYGLIEKVERVMVLTSPVTKVTISFLDRTETKQTVTYNLDPNAIIMDSNKLIDYQKLIGGKYAAFVIWNEQIKVISILSDYYVDGTVSEVAVENYNNAKVPFITVVQTDGQTRKYEVSENVTITRNDGKKVVTDFMKGDTVRLEIVAEKVAVITQSDNIYGIFDSYSIGTTANPTAFVVSINVNGTVNKYELASNVELKRNGEPQLITVFTKGDSVVMKTQDGKVTSIAATAVQSYNATIVEVIKGTITAPTTIYVKLRDTNGVDSTYPLADGCGISRAGKVATVDELAAGDAVTITLSDGKINTLVVNTPANKVTQGTIEEIAIGKTLKITIKDSAGNQSTHYAPTNIAVTIDNRVGDIYDLRTGYSASLTLQGENVTAITTSTPKLGNTITGTVVSVDLINQIVRVRQAETSLIINVYVPATTLISNAQGVSGYLFTDIKAKATIVVVGDGKGTADRYNAVTITIVQNAQ